MQIFHSLAEWRQLRASISLPLALGFVPTMGNLHAGHQSLVASSKQENDRSLVSIFVNRAQFNCQDDFINYPRTLDADLNLLERLEVDYCLLPSEEELFTDNCYQLEENQLSELMEGQRRPGHFSGMLTVVMKLFNLAKPQRAYFGEKDFQQYLLIRKMTEAFFMDIEIKACPTIRETCGLAYSSRNKLLNKSMRRQAEKFAAIFHQSKSSKQLTGELQEAGILIEYLEEFQGRIFIAVQIGNVRLIDNYPLISPLFSPKIAREKD